MVDLVELADRENVSVEEFMDAILCYTAAIANAAIDKHDDPDSENKTEFILHNVNYSYRITVERLPLPHSIHNGTFDRRKKQRA